MDLLLGFDIGTTALKVVLCSPERGVIAEAKRATELLRPQDGHVEFSSQRCYELLCEAIRELVAAAPSGSAIRGLALSGATGNTVLMVHTDAVEILRGRAPDPLEALPPDRRPGHRLWVYTNFHCNLSCDYCCVESSPRAAPRVVEVDEFERLVQAAVGAGVAELYVTGGEPFMLVDLDERLRVAAAALPTTVLTNAMVWTGERRRRLEALPRDGLTLQISLDSATAELHDRHRGAGSFERALDGIRTAMDLGFRVRVAATLGADAGDAERDLVALFDELGLSEDQRVVRRIARQGSANIGLTVSRSSLLPEVCVTAEGVWWHPVAAIDPGMKVADQWDPLDATIERWFTPQFRAQHDDYIQRVRGWVLSNDPRNYALARAVLAFGVVELIRPQPPIETPALVMTCENDSGSTPAMSRAIGSEIAGSEVVIVPRLQHMGLAEQPEIFIQALNGFLDSIAQRHDSGEKS